MENYTIDIKKKLYTRNLHEKYITCVEKLSQCYNNSNIILLNSGLQANMLAIYIIILLNKQQNINIIYHDDVYYESILMFNYLVEEYNIKLYKLDLTNFENNDINIIFIETCSNPFGRIFNFDTIKSIKNIYKKSYIICDNTWITHNIFNPLNYEIDVLTTSLSKYYSNNKLIGGCCIFNNKILYESLKKYVNLTGLHISIYTLNVLNDTLNNVDEVILYLSNLTQKIINYLLSLNIIVCHPFIKNHESFDLANKYFNGLYPSTFLIGFKKKLSNLKIIFNNLKIFKLEVSFGSIHTKIDPMVFYKNNISYLRISIGSYDTYDNIINGINELINIINNDKLYKLTL